MRGLVTLALVALSVPAFADMAKTVKTYIPYAKCVSKLDDARFVISHLAGEEKGMILKVYPYNLMETYSGAEFSTVGASKQVVAPLYRDVKITINVNEIDPSASSIEIDHSSYGLSCALISNEHSIFAEPSQEK